MLVKVNFADFYFYTLGTNGSRHFCGHLGHEAKLLAGSFGGHSGPGRARPGTYGLRFKKKKKKRLARSDQDDPGIARLAQQFDKVTEIHWIQT